MGASELWNSATQKRSCAYTDASTGAAGAGTKPPLEATTLVKLAVSAVVRVGEGVMRAAKIQRPAGPEQSGVTVTVFPYASCKVVCKDESLSIKTLCASPSA